MPEGVKVVAQNKKARHDYYIEDTVEAGVSLCGTEVKSVRLGRINFRDAYAQVKDGEMFLFNMHISPYEKGNIFNKDPMRIKKLLLHRSEINRLNGLVTQKGFTLVPLCVYLKKGLVKIELGVARGKKLYDKREDIAKRDAQLAMRRHVKEER